MAEGAPVGGGRARAGGVKARILGPLVGHAGGHLLRGPFGEWPPGGIFFYEFGSRKTRQVARTDKPLAVTDSGLAVSPDRRYILYTQIDQAGSDLLILERR